MFYRQVQQLMSLSMPTCIWPIVSNIFTRAITQYTEIDPQSFFHDYGVVDWCVSVFGDLFRLNPSYYVESSLFSLG